MKDYPFKPYQGPYLDGNASQEGLRQFRDSIMERRSVRHFSEKAVSRAIIEQIIEVAGSAPSGANKQPWHFCAISDPSLKARIRKEAEAEEYKNYHGRMSDDWIEDLKPLATDWHKPFLETAPWLIIMFKKPYEIEGGKQKKNYYVNESAGIAAGFLIAAIHAAGLVTLTHTPSPMNFLEKILDRPENERAFLILPVGYPAKECMIPDIQKYTLNDISTWHETPKTIDCNLYDQYEAWATMQVSLKIEYLQDGMRQTAQGTIKDLYTKSKREFMLLNRGDIIPLDSILSAIVSD